MEVITIESTAYKEIMAQLQEIKTAVGNNHQPKKLEDRLLTSDEAAAFLHVTKRTLQSYRNEGKISFCQIGSKIYYRMSWIEEFLQNHHHKAFKYKR